MTRHQVMQGYCPDSNTVDGMLSAYDDLSDSGEDFIPSWFEHPVNIEVHDEET